MTTADEQKIRELRDLLPATGAGIYLDTASRGPLPAETAAAMREAEDWELRVGRVWPGRDEDVEQRAAEAGAVVAALIGADLAHIILTNGRDDALLLAQPVAARGGRVIDATHQAGVARIDVGSLGADAIVLACDRWLLGPEATGAVWLSEGAADRRELPRTTLIGLARSVGWLEMFVGLDWIYARTAALATRLNKALIDCPGVEVVTPSDAVGAIITIRLGNWKAADAAEELSRRIHALVRVIPDPHAIRASVAWFNTEDEIDRFVGAVRELAAHTPDTLPRRPSIVIR